MRKQTQAGEGVLTKLRFRDDELKTWQISESYKNYYVLFKIQLFSWITEVLKSGNTVFFLLLSTIHCSVFFFSWERMVPVSVKLALGSSVQGQVICHAGVGFCPVPPDTLQKHMMKDSNGEEEVAARSLFCGLQVGHLLGTYKSWIKFLNSV